MKPRLSAAQLVAILVSLGAYAGLAYYTPRQHFGPLLGLYAVAFAGYAWLLHRPLPLRYGLLLALAARLLWLPAVPALSDDYFRFQWDGALVASGQNPYLYRPEEVMFRREPSTAPEDMAMKQVYPRLNSAQYYSVYPPVCQAIFGVASWLFPFSQSGFLMVLRLVVLAAEAATALLLLALLGRLGLPAPRAGLYLLNPLVIVELTGNLHFEALLICGVLAALWLVLQGRWALSAAALGLAVATKLLPLLLLPLLLRRLSWRHFLLYGTSTAAVVAVLFAPFLSAALVQNLSRSLDLYFHKFEFNASLYYALRTLGYWYTGYNQIARLGSLLGGATVIFILALARFEKRPTLASLPQALLFALSGYFLLATTVHPWYLTTLIALSVFARYRYALVWSALIPLSYAAYQTAAYTENMALVVLEYSIVAGVMLWEIVRARSSKTLQPPN